jgi:large subunit ribosomal protein L13
MPAARGLGNEYPMRTISAKPEQVERGWYLVDAEGRTLGRLATEIARRLRGKHKPIYTPHVDTGDYIVVVNAARIRVTGKKLQDKQYQRFTGYVGNLKTESLGDLMARAPERALRLAVKGMLPKNSLGSAMLRKLKIFPGAEHAHAAQQPQRLEL